MKSKLTRFIDHRALSNSAINCLFVQCTDTMPICCRLILDLNIWRVYKRRTWTRPICAWNYTTSRSLRALWANPSYRWSPLTRRKMRPSWHRMKVLNAPSGSDCLLSYQTELIKWLYKDFEAQPAIAACPSTTSLYNRVKSSVLYSPLSEDHYILRILLFIFIQSTFSDISHPIFSWLGPH